MCILSVSVVADSPKGEAVTNQNYNKICDILSFIKYKTQDIHAENLNHLNQAFAVLSG